MDKTTNASTDAGTQVPSDSMQLIEFEQFDTSFAVNPNDESNVRRRFMTLLAKKAVSEDRLSDCEVLRAQNTEGEWFALKRLRPIPADTNPFARRGREAALFEEYRNQLAVSHLQGFPRVYGYGVTHEGDPAILMEWIHGKTLRDASNESLLPRWNGEGCPGTTVASLGLSVLQALISTTYLEGTFAHRDISPRNIMIRSNKDDSTLLGWTNGEPLDCCLIDLGSAIFMRRDEATFTMTMDVWRNATPEYAPPEMLALNDRSFIEARRSPKIDVYALCSVLYELYSGRTPYALADHPNANAYELKTSSLPKPLAPHAATDQPLVDAIMSGLATRQADRPDAQGLFARIANWQHQVTGKATTIKHEPVPPKSAGAHLWSIRHNDNQSETSMESRATNTPSTRPNAAKKSEQGLYAPGTARGRINTGTGTTTADQYPAGGNHGSENLVISRRSLLIGAGCVAGAAALGAGWATQGFGLLRPRTFDDNSWDQIAKIATDIAAASSKDDATSVAVRNGIANEDGTMVDGLTKSIQLTDGTQTSVQVVDYYHDDTDDGGKAGLTFAFTEPIAVRNMSDEAMAYGGWEQCDLRSWLNSDVLSTLPSDLANHVLPVQKATNNMGAAREYDDSLMWNTLDNLWLFSIVEMGGPRNPAAFATGYGYLGQIISAEGSQYQLFKDKQISSMASSNDGSRRQWNGKDCYWWLRSPSPDCSADDGQTWFNRVGPNGDVFHFAVAATGEAENQSTVLPGFCL